MGPEEKYLFDLWGYVNIEGVLGDEELAELNALIDAQDYPDPVDDDVYSQRFGGFLNWENDAFRKLLNHPRIMPFLAEIVGPKFRLDHVYGILMIEGAIRAGRSTAVVHLMIQRSTMSSETIGCITA